MAPFLSATTCERAPMARASLSICIQSSHAEQSWATPFWCSAQRRPTTAIEAAALFMPQWSMPAVADEPCTPQCQLLDLPVPVLLAVTAEAPLAPVQPMAAAAAALFS